MKKEYTLKSKDVGDSMPYEREEVFIGDKKIGEIGTALSCSPFGGQLWRYCYRPEGMTKFDWEKGFIFYAISNQKDKAEVEEKNKDKQKAKIKAIKALMGTKEVAAMRKKIQDLIKDNKIHDTIEHINYR